MQAYCGWVCIFSRMNGAKLFSVFYASNGFWQVELDDESGSLTTCNTLFGHSASTVHRKFGSAKCEST